MLTMKATGAAPRWNFHKYLVDRSGRIQIPRELVERLHIGGRAQLEVHEGYLAVRPAAGLDDGAE